MLIEIHLLKNYPSVNLNRDDTGTPKQAIFGNVLRGRISSQCLKRAVRQSASFREEIGNEHFGIRTRMLPDLVSERLSGMGVNEKYIDAIKPKITGFGTKEGKETKENATAQVIFFAPEDIQAVADGIKTLLDNCKDIKEVKKLSVKDIRSAIYDASVRPVTLDIALFGRMVTDDSFKNVPASMQVAHAISTNRVTAESDYFTAMDDLLSGSNDAGAAMLGDMDFNSCCYYHYFSLDTDILAQNLSYNENPQEIIRTCAPALLRAIAFTNPGGKQNSFAGHVMPCAVLVDCKDKKIPTSLVNAFVEPVRGGNLENLSIQALANEADSLLRNFGLPVKERIWFNVDKYDVTPASATKICKTFSELVDAVSATM